MPLKPSRLLTLALLVLSAATPQLHAQTPRREAASVSEPTTPAAQHFHDSRYHVAFDLPAAWNLSRRDGEVSTFHLDARSAAPTAQLRAVASIAFNPYPLSTFSGALVYFSVTPRINDADCASQAFLPLHRPATTESIHGVSFAHGSDEHGGVCIESRDEVYTAFRNHACYRFDLVLNTFCGEQVGARAMTHAEMENIRARQQKILDSLDLNR
jgi:hypothetical protein